MKEVSKKPLVDVLTDLTAKQVVMSGDDYVYFSDSKKVTKILVDEAIALQELQFNQEVKEQEEKRIDSEIEVLEQKSLRPLIAIQTAQALNKTPDKRDIEKLEELEASIVALREERSKL